MALFELLLRDFQQLLGRVQAFFEQFFYFLQRWDFQKVRAASQQIRCIFLQFFLELLHQEYAHLIHKSLQLAGKCLKILRIRLAFDLCAI